MAKPISLHSQQWRNNMLSKSDLKDELKAEFNKHTTSIQQAKQPAELNGSGAVVMESKTYLNLDIDALSESIANVIITHLENKLEILVPPATFLVGATAGVPNPAPVSLKLLKGL